MPSSGFKALMKRLKSRKTLAMIEQEFDLKSENSLGTTICVNKKINFATE